MKCEKGQTFKYLVMFSRKLKTQNIQFMKEHMLTSDRLEIEDLCYFLIVIALHITEVVASCFSIY